MNPRIVDLVDDDGNLVYETNADGSQKLDAAGNPIVKTVEAYDKSDVEAFLKEKEELAEKIRKLEEDNRIKDENFKRMRGNPQTPQQPQPQVDVNKVVAEQLRKRDIDSATATAQGTFSSKLGGDQSKVDAAMVIFNKLFDADKMNTQDAINIAMNAVSPHGGNSNWNGGGHAGSPQAKPATEDFSKSPERSFAYKEINQQLNKINLKENRLWNKPKA